MIEQIFKLIILFVTAFYQWGISPALHLFFGPSMGCRYQPTCSHYSNHAIQLHGIWRGAYLSLLRILRCHPFSKPGYDPVPHERVPYGP